VKKHNNAGNWKAQMIILKARVQAVRCAGVCSIIKSEELNIK
jgi:hypothetical protein